MSATLRVQTAVFKSNMRPFVDEARAGNSVIVTNDGRDDFQILPLGYSGPPPVAKQPLAADAYRGIDTDEPGFKPLE